VKNKSLINLFSSGLQAIAIQIFGVAFFYIISLYLTKDSFGLISWCIAVSSFITVVLGLGLEQSVVRRVALSKTSFWVVYAFLLHTIISSVIISGILFIIYFFSPDKTGALRYLPWIFFSQALLYIATPLKQYLNAKEKFTPYGIISFVSNLSKTVLAIVLVSKNALTIPAVIYMLIGFSLFELIALLVYVVQKNEFQVAVKRSAYTKLVKESLPLYLASLFDTSLSRMDWILLGLLSTNIATADYSFAYRAYEVAKIPAFIIGPIILPKFVRLFSSNDILDGEKKKQINDLFTIEIFFATCVVLCLNIVWADCVGFITHGKYGSSNSVVFFILSLCLPFQFIINMFWTICYAEKKYREISTVNIITAISNIALNLVLIPIYGGQGAAIAFVSAILIQTAAYYYYVQKSAMSFSFIPLVILIIIAISSYGLSSYITVNIWLRVIIALPLYLLLSLLLKQVGKQHLNTIKLYLKR
jgi:O-antigen/teichoic acid export membrane protein